eukprot:6175292-Pleurochrysis_carterae.AAC.4
MHHFARAIRHLNRQSPFPHFSPLLRACVQSLLQTAPVEGEAQVRERHQLESFTAAVITRDSAVTIFSFALSVLKLYDRPTGYLLGVTVVCPPRNDVCSISALTWHAWRN